MTTLRQDIEAILRKPVPGMSGVSTVPTTAELDLLEQLFIKYCTAIIGDDEAGKWNGDKSQAGRDKRDYLFARDDLRDELRAKLKEGSRE